MSSFATLIQPLLSIDSLAFVPFFPDLRGFYWPYIIGNISHVIWLLIKSLKQSTYHFRYLTIGSTHRTLDFRHSPRPRDESSHKRDRGRRRRVELQPENVKTVGNGLEAVRDEASETVSVGCSSIGAGVQADAFVER